FEVQGSLFFTPILGVARIFLGVWTFLSEKIKLSAFKAVPDKVLSLIPNAAIHFAGPLVVSKLVLPRFSSINSTPSNGCRARIKIPLGVPAFWTLISISNQLWIE